MGLFEETMQAQSARLEDNGPQRYEEKNEQHVPADPQSIGNEDGQFPGPHYHSMGQPNNHCFEPQLARDQKQAFEHPHFISFVAGQATGGHPPLWANPIGGYFGGENITLPNKGTLTGNGTYFYWKCDFDNSIHDVGSVYTVPANLKVNIVFSGVFSTMQLD